MAYAAKMRAFAARYGQGAGNVLLATLFAGGAVWRAYQALTAPEFDYVEVAYFVRNLVFVIILLVRQDHVAVSHNVGHQSVALVAFFSGIAFDPEPSVESQLLIGLSRGVTVAALILATIALINLGRSFGILISVRKVRTRGLYGIIRHPLYAIDILWRVGFILSNPGLGNFVVFALSSAAYVYRALLEEKFLSKYPEYREYMQQTRYRFIPGLF